MAQVARVVRTMYRFTISLMAMTFVVSLAGCAATQRDRTEAEPVPRSSSGDPMASDEASNMLADDADAFEAKPARQEPARRPPDVRRSRPVDQPRVRP